MKKVQVRCWKVSHPRPESSEVDELFITYPEDNSGHSLITCLTCGAIYAVTVAKEIYVGPPLAEKLLSCLCSMCGSLLANNWRDYPETYVVNGQRFSYERAVVVPPDEESSVEEFDGIYES